MQIPHLLSIVIFLPLVFGFVLLFVDKEKASAHGGIALAGTLATFLVSLLVYFGYHSGGTDQFQFKEMGQWAPGLHINYNLGVDGIGVLMVLMTTVIFPFVVGISQRQIKERTKMFYFLLLLEETAILGTFTGLNLVLFYIFYEAMLIPLYFLIGMWGGEKRVYATLKFFLYTMVGSMLMLVSIISMYFMVGTFDLQTLQGLLPTYLWSLPGHGLPVEMLLFGGFFAAFAVKAPLWPFHTWVPDAYTEAPTGATVILVALKMGLYGFIRFCLPLFPHAVQECAPVIVALAVIGVIVAALTASVQTDMKRLLAYSSVSHIGVIMLAIFGLTAAGISGSVIQMFSHTLTTGALFIIVSLIAVRRGGSYAIADYGGVWKVMPYLGALFVMATLSAIALPGTSGFTGEFLMLIGSFQTHPWAAGIATTAAIWSAVYMLWMYQRVMTGPIVKPEVAEMRDIRPLEKWVLVPLILIIIWLGVYPKPFEDKINTPVTTILAQVGVPIIAPSPIGGAGTLGAPAVASLPVKSDGVVQLAHR